MASTNSNPAVRIRYNGKFTHGVDEKRRVQIPARWLPAEGSIEFTVIVWPKHPAGKCLRVLPPCEVDELMAELDAMPSSDPRKGLLKRAIGSNSVQVPVDKAGRITLPEEMAREAGLDGEARLVGLLDRFEIWNPQRYAAVEASDETRLPAAFDLLE
jgi:MraZ protein